jgi:hypothetical protein
MVKDLLFWTANQVAANQMEHLMPGAAASIVGGSFHGWCNPNFENR